MISDPRRRANGTPLRKSINLSLLQDSPDTENNKHDCLYEAQVSCMITGYNSTAWVAYVFVDSFFHHPNDAENIHNDTDEESIAYYQSSTELSEGFAPDPIARGCYDATMPIWEPRVYFLSVLTVRLEQIEEQWRNTEYAMRGVVENFVSVRFPLSSVRCCCQDTSDTYTLCQ